MVIPLRPKFLTALPLAAALLAAPAFQNSLLDHIVERRRVADMARPDFIEHAIGAFRDAEGFRLGEVEIVRALK